MKTTEASNMEGMGRGLPLAVQMTMSLCYHITL
jgi:hypothetical protein